MAVIQKNSRKQDPGSIVPETKMVDVGNLRPFKNFINKMCLQN